MNHQTTVRQLKGMIARKQDLEEKEIILCGMMGETLHDDEVLKKCAFWPFPLDQDCANIKLTER